MLEGILLQIGHLFFEILLLHYSIVHDVDFMFSLITASAVP